MPRMKAARSFIVLSIFLLCLGRALAADSSAVDINSASAAELKAVKGIGEATATKIISSRPYKSLDDLTKAGLSVKKIDKLRPYLTVGAAAAATASAPPVSAGAARASAPAKATSRAAAGPVDLNSADEATLETLPGVGPAMAKKIVAGRPYKTVDDLGNVKGIGAAKLAALRDKVTVGGGSTTAPSIPPPAAPASAPSVPASSSAKPPAPAAASHPAVASTASKLAPGEKVNLNSATAEELDALPGIGPVKAQAIIAARPFKTIEDVMKVKGIKQGTFAKIKDHITVE
jgi:competence protein ComEA